MPTVEVTPETYERLARRATATHTSMGDVVAAALETLPAEHEPAHRPPRDLSDAEFERLLDAMAIGVSDAPSPEITHSREDIYFDHD